MEILLKPASMKLFYLTFPQKYEDEVIQKVGSLGAVQPSKEYTVKGFSKVDNIDICEKYIKLQQRIESILSTITDEKPRKKSIFETLKSIFKKPLSSPPKAAIPKADLGEINEYVSVVESKLDAKLSTLDELQTDIDDLKSLVEKASLIKKYGMKIGDVGDFEHLFVKIGFLNNEFLPRLKRYAEGTSIKYFSHPERRKENFIAITGVNEDKPHIEEALTLLNFEEISLPDGLTSDPTKVIHETEKTILEKERELGKVKKEIEGISNQFKRKAPAYEPPIRRTLRIEDARACLSRTRNLSLMHGWIPVKKVNTLKSVVQEITKGAAYTKFEDPSPKDNPPIQLENKGVFSYFDLLIRMRGIPKYFELDPTPITMVLFTIMFGMMFGDIGQGAVFVVLGYIFNRSGKSFLGIPGGAIKKLGGILFICGLSSIFFGFLYGTIFLVEAFHPLFISPIHEQTTIMIIALVFGVVQIILGIILNIVNNLRRKNFPETILGGHGVTGLIYYIGGVMLAIRFSYNMSLDVFMNNLPFTIIVLGALILIFFSPIIESFLKGALNFKDDLMIGFGHAIETFIAFLTNSVSYVRLAAFAMAHGALGIAAVILAGMVGVLPSFLLLNVLVILIEGMSTLIQSMRLTYYEFFTKFYSGGGTPYRPFILERA